jgi:PHD/YefM family antitoxin component YafN of YafNO toxin-antitoxin module
MPRIIPIRDLKDTTAISQMCQESTEPVYITKNGYGDMVIMSMKAYEEKLFMADVYSKLAEAEAQISEGKTVDARDAMKSLRTKYGL